MQATDFRDDFRQVRADWIANHSLNRTDCGVPVHGPPFILGQIPSRHDGPVSSKVSAHNLPPYPFRFVLVPHLHITPDQTLYFYCPDFANELQLRLRLAPRQRTANLPLLQARIHYRPSPGLSRRTSEGVADWCCGYAYEGSQVQGPIQLPRHSNDQWAASRRHSLRGR